MDEPILKRRISDIRQLIAARRDKLQGRMNTLEVLNALELTLMPGDRAAISAALAAEGMTHCITHEPGKFTFSPA